MKTPVESTLPKAPISAEKQAQVSATASPMFTVVMCIFSMVIGVLGYRYYLTKFPIAKNILPKNEITEMSKPTVVQPSPTPIPLHAGKGDYTVSHPKSAGPVIQRVIFDPLDAKKGEKVKFSAVIMDTVGDAKVVGALDADSKQIELTFTKDGMERNSQIWSTELTLTDSVLYRYILTVSATNSKGNTVVRVSPRS